MSKMYLNIVHRIENNPNLHEGVKFQQDECHRLQLKTTLLIGYPAMLNPEYAAYAAAEAKRNDVELGISFHDITCDELQELIGTKEWAFYLLGMEAKKLVIDRVFTKFREIYGYIPSSIAGYIMDANTLRYIKTKYPQVKAAITNCFEEGVKMFAGNCNGWMLFSDGGPWGAYYPSKDNHLIPARDKEDYVGIVGLPHLNRDMVLALTSRDDYFASHPINVMRAKANEGSRSPYMYHFYDQWVKQAEYNGYSYYNVFVSAGWITPGFQEQFVENHDDARRMYTDALEYYRLNMDRGNTQCVTMTEFAEWFEDKVEIAQPEVNLWNEMLCGTKRQNFWYIDPYFRMAIDMNQGGAIIDLRPYASHYDNNIGIDTKALYNGSNPFIISSEHRNTEASCYLEYKGQRVSNKDKRVKAHIEKNQEGNQVLLVDPISFQFEDTEIVLYSSFTFRHGEVTISRKMKYNSAQSEKVKVIETFKGCYGTDQYPENMKGIIMQIQNKETKKDMIYSYIGREIALEAPTIIKTIIPQVETCVEMSANLNVDKAKIEEGYLFNPFYYMSMEGSIADGEEMVTCLRIKKNGND